MFTLAIAGIWIRWDSKFKHVKENYLWFFINRCRCCFIFHHTWTSILSVRMCKKEKKKERQHSHLHWRLHLDPESKQKASDLEKQVSNKCTGVVKDIRIRFHQTFVIKWTVQNYVKKKGIRITFHHCGARCHTFRLVKFRMIARFGHFSNEHYWIYCIFRRIFALKFHLKKRHISPPSIVLSELCTMLLWNLRDTKRAFALLLGSRKDT